MIKGEKQDIITSEEILSKTNGGYDIFMHYLGDVKRNTHCPWRRDKYPSWGVYKDKKTNNWFWKDMAKEESGTAIQFVEKLFNLDFKGAIDKIRYDFGWSKIINIHPVKVTWESPEEKEISYSKISFSPMSFTKKHHEFWNCVGVTEEYCKKFNCYAVKEAALNRKRVFIKKDEIVFAYYAPEEDGVKLYFPERQKGEKFLGNVSYHYLWNYNNIPKCNKLIIQKSMKDLIVTSLLFPCVIATQAEAIKIFDVETKKKIDNVTKEVYISYGSDDDGKHKSISISKKFDWKWVNPPSKYLPEVNDFYSMVKTYGIKSIELELKKKKLI